MSKSSKALADIKGKAEPKTVKKEAQRVPLTDMRLKMRQASAPEAAAEVTPPWEEEKQAGPAVNNDPIQTSLAALAAIGIHPVIETPAATEMPAVTHNAAPPAAPKEPETIDNHPLFKAIQRPSYQPQPVSKPAPGVVGHAYAGFNTPLGQVSNTHATKAKEAPKKSTAVFAASNSPL